MRNSTPVILSLLLALAAIFLIATSPDEKTASAPPAPAETTEPTEARPWPHQSSDLSADPKAVFGSLENGLRYIILPNDEPPQRLSLRMHIAAGSLMEKEDQRGLAHFLEHMVFNGSKNFTPDELIPRMQRLGIGFGAHVNAYTSFDETVYMLDLPERSEQMLDLGFTVMRDFADGALLEPEEIDRERGVILAEKTARDSVDFRVMKEQFRELMPDALITQRFPIGTEEVIRNAPRERFVEFYRNYYVPERITFVAVGDISPPEIEQRIEQAFASMTNPEEPPQPPALGELRQPDDVEALVFSDEEVAATELSLLTIETFEPRPDTRETRRRRLALELAHAMLGTRFERLARREGAPILDGSASRSDLFNFVTLGGIDVRVADDRWRAAVTTLEQEFRRVLEFGFTSAEFAEARANLLNRYEQAAESMESRKSDQLATQIVRGISDRRVLSSPVTDYEVASRVLEQLDKEACAERFRKFWKGKGRFVLLKTPNPLENGEQRLLETFRESTEQTLEPPQEVELKDFAYDDFGAAGEIVETVTEEDLSITRLTLSNGITVNLKPTAFTKNRVSLQARVGHGTLTAPNDQEGLVAFASAVVSESGIGVHPAEELEQLLAGKNVSRGFSVQDGYFEVSGSTTPQDLELQLKVMAAQIMHPAFRSEAIAQFRKQVPMYFQQLKHTPAGPMQQMSEWLRGNDPRFSLPDDPAPLLAYEAADVQPWLAEAFTGGGIELNIVGDFDPESVQEPILATFGALPQRPKREESPELDRSVDFPAFPQEKSLTFESRIPQARSNVIWQCSGPRSDPRRFRRLQLLADILGDRLRKEIREKLGASYSPNAGASGSMALKDFGYLTAACTGTPGNVELLAEASIKLADAIAAEGIDADELERARNPALASIDKSLRDNGYWLGNVLSGSSADPRRLELARDRKEDIKSITLEELNSLAAEYLSKDRAIQVLIQPGKPAADAPGSD